MISLNVPPILTISDLKVSEEDSNAASLFMQSAVLVSCNRDAKMQRACSYPLCKKTQKNTKKSELKVSQLVNLDIINMIKFSIASKKR